MSSQRGSKTHLPSHSGDFDDAAAARPGPWRKGPVLRPGIALRTDIDEDDTAKSPLTVLRVWFARQFLRPGSGTRSVSRRRNSRLLVLVLFICAVYFFGPWGRRDKGSATTDRVAASPSTDQTQKERAQSPKRKHRLGTHKYRPNGLLEVNPNGTHPIFELIANAEAKWNAKLRKASATLREAVEEYVRRYRRPPPKGFDKWWEYVQENNVQLPDEYDSIHERLEPFWGIHPLDLRKILADWEDHSDVPVMVFGKIEGRPVRILKNGMPENERVEFAKALRERLDLMLDIEDMLPDFRAIISPADTPNLLTDWELKEQALEAAAANKYIDIEAPPPPKHGWLSACAPDTPVYRRHLDFYAPAPVDMLRPKKKTFIHDHRAAMDPCGHPAHLFLSGQFLSHHEGPSPHRVLVPQFSSSASALHYDLLPIPPRGWGEERRDIAWERKHDERLLWRGLNTGMMCNVGSHWQQSQRVRLVDVANGVDGDVAVLLPPKEGEEGTPVGEAVKWPRARINPAMLDIAFSGSPVQCDEATCAELVRDFDWRRHMPLQESSRYKYVIDIDGNGWSSRFKRLMASNALVFKSTVYPEWFTDRIQPWVHYVPISLDYSDLYDTFIFFRGGLNGEGNHDNLAKKIGLEGSKWTDTFWRDEDATAYMFRLFLEYARVMALDRESMSMKVSSDP